MIRSMLAFFQYVAGGPYVIDVVYTYYVSDSREWFDGCSVANNANN